MPFKTIEVPVRKHIVLKAFKNDSTIDGPDYLLIELTSAKAKRLLVQREIVDSIADPAFHLIRFVDHQAHWFVDFEAMKQMPFSHTGLCIAPDGWIPQWTNEVGEETLLRTGGSYVELRKDQDPIWCTSGPATGEPITSARLPWEVILRVAMGEDLPAGVLP